MSIAIHQPEWRKLKVGECLQKTQSARRPSIPKEQYQKEGVYPIVDQSVEFIAGWTDVKESVVNADLPLIIFGDHTRIFKYVDFPFAAGADGTKILHVNKDELDPFFFFYALRNLDVPNKGYSRHFKYLRELEISFPVNKDEQRIIAYILRAVQEAKEARQRELTLERERKAALMQYLFTHGTRGEARKQTEIGEIPESWQIILLETVFETQLGKMLSQKAKAGQNPKPYVRNANVQWGRVDCSDIYEMDFDKRESEKFRLKYEDILVCEGGEVGRTAIWRNELPECYFQKAIHRLRPRNNEMNSDFFLYWMERAFRFTNIYGIAGTQTTIAHLPQEKLKVMLIPKPSVDEQNLIATILNTCDAKIDALEKESSLLEELFKAMLEELMTGKLRVKF